MTHHSENHNPSPAGENGSYRMKDNTIAISILIGAILISASIFYSTRVDTRSKAVPLANNPSGQTANAGQTAQPGAPEGPFDVAERADAAVFGNENAPVTIVEFTDFQCPFCQRFFNDAYKQIKEKYIDTGKARVVFRHFPLSFHQNAQKAAEAAECANRQGKFIEYHDLLFQKMQADGTGLDIASLKAYAADLRLSTSRFNSCLDNGDTAGIVKSDMDAGQAAGVSGTPTFFINGMKIVGALPFSSFEQAIEAELSK